MQVNTQTTSVIICCYAVDRIEWVVQAVDSVLKQTQKPKEVIVVFDKKDGLEGVLKQKLPNSVFIIPNQAKKGLSLARNTGAKVASGDILIFLDDDAVAEPDWLKHLIDPFSDPWVVGVGGKAVPGIDEQSGHKRRGGESRQHLPVANPAIKYGNRHQQHQGIDRQQVAGEQRSA